jgi:protein phosphatase
VSATKVILPKVEVAHRSDPGRDPDKQVNEDCCRYGETAFGHLVVLCDGMGGHEGGREASVLGIESIFRHFSAAPLRADIPAAVRAREVLRDAIQVANREIFALGASRGAHRPGSTVVAALMHALGTEVAHVGDSRCYLLHAGEVRQVTRDHSTVQRMVDAGQLTPAEAAVHPDANVITRALGMAGVLEVEVQRASVAHAAGDTFLLCSDGLSDLVETADMTRILLSSPPPQATRELVDLANARGGHDNITVALMVAREAAAPSRDSVGELPSTGVTTSVMPATGVTIPGTPPGSSPAPPGLARTQVPSAARHRRAERTTRMSPAVVLGVVLGLVGVAAVALTIVLLVAPHGGRTNAVPGLSLATSLPSTTLGQGPVAAPSGVQPPSDPNGDAATVEAGGRVRHYRNSTNR